MPIGRSTQRAGLTISNIIFVDVTVITINSISSCEIIMADLTFDLPSNIFASTAGVLLENKSSIIQAWFIGVWNRADRHAQGTAAAVCFVSHCRALSTVDSFSLLGKIVDALLAFDSVRCWWTICAGLLVYGDEPIKNRSRSIWAI